MRSHFLLMPLTLLFCISAVCADPASEARHTIQKAYAAVDSAVAHKDVSGATAFFSPDFTSTDLQGKVTTGEQQRQSATQVFAHAHSISSKTTIMTFSLAFPNQATVTAHSHIQIVLPGPTPTSQTTKVVLDVTERDQWVKMSAGWRETSDKVLTQSLTANGKPLPKSP